MSYSNFSLAALAILCVASLGGVREIVAQDKADVKTAPTSYWMKKKLDFSQNILAGIATADFDAIAENAESIRRLSSVEGFFRRQTPGYAAQLQTFEQAVDEMIRQARKDNVEGAALAFTQMTISCVNCHKHLRESK